jgi:murein L,D-transpeptidase YafK
VQALANYFLLLVLLSSILAAAAETTTSAAPKIDRILILKSERNMHLMAGEKVIKTYKVALGSQPVGAKERQGDGKTPEGKYSISGKNPKSQFHLSLRISYPNAADRARAKKLGVSPGGDIVIHGIGKTFGWLGARHRLTDWTLGCIAVTNEEIEELYTLVRIGTAVEIRP